MTQEKAAVQKTTYLYCIKAILCRTIFGPYYTRLLHSRISLDNKQRCCAKLVHHLCCIQHMYSYLGACRWNRILAIATFAIEKLQSQHDHVVS